MGSLENSLNEIGGLITSDKLSATFIVFWVRVVGVAFFVGGIRMF
jgi:hypothetical protein